MIIGITGGIGSGKSLVTDYLKNQYGFFTIKTDDLAREMMNEDEKLKKELAGTFGSDIYLEDGNLNKRRYAELIHSDASLREKSDKIVHPAVWLKVVELIKENCGKDKEFRNVAVETALPGKVLKTICDHTVHVHTDKEERINRLMLYRGYSREYAESIIHGQDSEKVYIANADTVLDNSESIEKLYSNIDQLLKEILK